MSEIKSGKLTVDTQHLTNRMSKYLSFIRGINVGGNNIIKMEELRAALEKEGYEAVKTYIQTGNIITEHEKIKTQELSKQLEKCLKKHFKVETQVVSFSQTEWDNIIKKAPKTWGENPDWKHNIFIVIAPQTPKGVIAAAGEIKKDIEWAAAGKGVVYQSVSREQFGKSRFSKIPSQKVYQEITIRNFNTATKLLKLLKS